MKKKDLAKPVKQGLDGIAKKDRTIMFAVIKTGGKQYRVAAGDEIRIEKLEGAAGDTLALGDVLMSAPTPASRSVPRSLTAPR